MSETKFTVSACLETATPSILRGARGVKKFTEVPKVWLKDQNRKWACFHADVAILARCLPTNTNLQNTRQARKCRPGKRPVMMGITGTVAMWWGGTRRPMRAANGQPINHMVPNSDALEDRHAVCARVGQQGTWGTLGVCLPCREEISGFWPELGKRDQQHWFCPHLEMGKMVRQGGVSDHFGTSLSVLLGRSSIHLLTMLFLGPQARHPLSRGLQKGVGGQGNPSYARDSGLFSAPFFLCPPLRERGRDSGGQFLLCFGPCLSPTPSR